MRLMTMKKISMLLCIILMLGLTGCNNAPEETNTDSYLELVDTPSTTLDNVWYNPGGIFRCAVFESLLIPNADMTEYEHALAQNYSVSEDGLTYTFTLRRDATWHDGEAFDASDVLFSIKTALRCGEVNGLFTSAFYSIEGAKDYADYKSDGLSGVTVDRNVVTIRLLSPSSSFLNAIAQFAILPEHILKDVNPPELSASSYWESPIGCGCYKITDAVSGEYFILEAYKDYYGEPAGVKKIRLRLNETDCVTAMQEGRLDFYITNDPEEIATLKGIETCSEHRLNIMFPAYLIMNISDDEGTIPELKDVRVREALLLAIDRNTIVDAIFPGSTVTDTLVPTWNQWYYMDATEYNFDPDRACELLKEANFDFSKTIRLRYSTKGQSSYDLMQAIAVYWRAIGLNVEVAKFDGSGSEHMFNVRDYDVCYKRLSAFNYASIYEEVHSNGVMQTKLFHQPVYDELLAQLELTTDETKRQEIIRDMQVLDQKYLLRIPLFSLANVAYVNDAHFSMPDAYGNLWYRYNLHFEEWKLVK